MTSRSPLLAFVAAFLSANALGCESEPEPEPETSSLPPPPVADAPAGDGAGVMLAVGRFHLGTDGNGVAGEWRDYGYDLDGMVTHGDLTGHCKQVEVANPNTLEDGLGGVDNAFGSVLAPGLDFLQGVARAPTAALPHSRTGFARPPPTARG